MSNEELREVYNKMHSEGSTAWFSDGREERETILKMGEPWKKTLSLEIGCGEGDLAAMIVKSGGNITAIDYSPMAINKAKTKWPFMSDAFRVGDINQVLDTAWSTDLKRIVMQGVLEHLDDPFGTLHRLIEYIKPEMVITSSPCFLNPRGIVWMTLDMLGAVMSKTDLHFLHPWQFDEFVKKYGYKIKRIDCDTEWGSGAAMLDDFWKRIPLALRDGNIPFNKKALMPFLTWLWKTTNNEFKLSGVGATMVYRITT